MLREVINMNKDTDLHSKIDILVRELNSYYSVSLEGGTSLKDKIDGMEKHVGEKCEDGEFESKRDLTVEQLDALVDSLVLTCSKLDSLRECCKRVQDLTTSFLCYSLSRFRESKKAEKKE